MLYKVPKGYLVSITVQMQHLFENALRSYVAQLLKDKIHLAMKAYLQGTNISLWIPWFYCMFQCCLCFHWHGHWAEEIPGQGQKPLSLLPRAVACNRRDSENNAKFSIKANSKNKEHHSYQGQSKREGYIIAIRT